MKIKLTLPFETLRRFGVPDALVDLAAQVTETVSMGVIQATEDADTAWEAPVAPPPPRRAAVPTAAEAAAYTAASDAPAKKAKAEKAAPKKAAPKKAAPKKAPKKAEAKAEKPAPKKAAPKKAAAKKAAPKKAAPKKAEAEPKKAAKKAAPKKAAAKKAKDAVAAAPGKKTAAIAASDNPWQTYYDSLPERSQNFLDVLEKRGSMTIDEAVEIMGLASTRSLGGVTGALSRWAPKAGVELPYETGTNDEGRRYWTWTRK